MIGTLNLVQVLCQPETFPFRVIYATGALGSSNRKGRKAYGSGSQDLFKLKKNLSFATPLAKNLPKRKPQPRSASGYRH